jgi:phosphoribosylformylglycinamidine (FGAM) synthase-like enzyme
VKLEDYYFEETDEESQARFYAWLPEKEEEDNEEVQEEVKFKSSPYESRHPWISETRGCHDTFVPDPSSWIIYIPFDTCTFRIGGSLLAQTQGRNGGVGPHINDPDYFIDCYEVVRELAEDGILMAGRTVADGGLAVAAALMCGENGMKTDLSGLMSSYQEEDTTKMLFAEVPGVLLQISDNDFDYLDSQLLLQDIAYYPVGHPTAEFKGLKFSKGPKEAVAGILASLLEQASEGED